LVCLLPADLESLPEIDIPILYNAMDNETDVVVGWRKNRGDGKILASKIYNFSNRILFNVKLHDANWIKLVRREKLQNLSLRSDWHRYLIPILVSRGCTVKEVVTEWRERTFGKSNFGLRRLPVSLADMISVKLMLSFSERPLLLFGWLAGVSISTSIFSLLVSLLFTSGGTLRSICFALSEVLLLVAAISFIVGLAVDLLRPSDSR